jgi:hypothetical protein
VKRSTGLWRLIVDVACSIGILCILVLVVVIDWLLAWDASPDRPHRLQLVSVAGRALVPGELLSADDVRIGLSFQRDNRRGDAVVKEVTGRYATELIPTGSTIHRTQVADRPATALPPGGGLASVNIPRGRAPSLLPGATVRFVPTDDGSGKRITKPIRDFGDTFRVIATGGAGRGSDPASILVSLEARQLSLASVLASGTWVPIVVDTRPPPKGKPSGGGRRKGTHTGTSGRP